MQIANSSVSFGQHSGSGPQVQTASVDMGAPVSQAIAFLSGFNVEFSHGHDHNLGLLDVQVQVPAGGISGSTVQVRVSYGLRDWSGDWDDDYEGQIWFSVVGQ
jgi:hypothetical protein